MSCYFFDFFFKVYVDHPDLHVLTHSHPPRRSSDRRVKARREGDEFGAGAGVKPSFVDDFYRPLFDHAASPRIADATEIYLRPASCAASTALATSIWLRTLASRISIGRLIPAITSTLGLPISEMEIGRAHV